MIRFLGRSPALALREINSRPLNSLCKVLIFFVAVWLCTQLFLLTSFKGFTPRRAGVFPEGQRPDQWHTWSNIPDLIGREVIAPYVEDEDEALCADQLALVQGYERRRSNRSLHAPDVKVLAVGWLSSEQMTQHTIQLASLLNVAMRWRRHVIAPYISGGHFVSLAGMDLPAPRKQQLPKTKPLSEVFDMAAIESALSSANVTMLPQDEGLSVCKSQWTLVFLASTWKSQLKPCFRVPELQARAQSLMENLLVHSESSITVEPSCEWMEECLSPELRCLRPFKSIICAGVRNGSSGMMSPADLAKELNVADAKCVMFVLWFGADRHGLQAYPADGLPVVRPIQFVTGSSLTAAAREVVRTSALLGSGFVGVHIRMEYLRLRCGPNPERCQNGQWLYAYCKRCFADLLEELRSSMPAHGRGTVLLFLDTPFESVSLELFDPLADDVPLFIRLWLDLKELFAHVVFGRGITEEKSIEKLPADPALRALVDLELFTMARRVFTVGGGHFQRKMLAIRQQRRRERENKLNGDNVLLQDYAVCMFSYKEPHFPLVFNGTRVVGDGPFPERA
eukprot:scpid68931/ scgid33302/ 